MKLPYKLHLLLWVLTFVTMSCSNDSSDLNDYGYESFDETQITIPESKPIEIEILELINNYRIGIGLNSLSASLDIIKYETSKHTDYMIVNGKISHDNFYQRESFLESYTGAVHVAENVAFGYNTAEEVVDAWLNSPGHKRNIEGDFTHFQITAKKDGRGIWFFTNIFVKK